MLMRIPQTSFFKQLTRNHRPAIVMIVINGINRTISTKTLANRLINKGHNKANCLPINITKRQNSVKPGVSRQLCFCQK